METRTIETSLLVILKDLLETEMFKEIELDNYILTHNTYMITLNNLLTNIDDLSMKTKYGNLSFMLITLILMELKSLQK